MAQGVTIKGKTPSGLNVEVRVDDDGNLLLANGGIFVDGGGNPVEITVNPDGSIPTSGVALITKIDQTTAAGITYIGKAAIGSLESASVWQIKRIDETGAVTDILYRGGSANFNNRWDQRTSGTYS